MNKQYIIECAEHILEAKKKVEDRPRDKKAKFWLNWDIECLKAELDKIKETA